MVIKMFGSFLVLNRLRYIYVFILSKLIKYLYVLVLKY